MESYYRRIEGEIHNAIDQIVEAHTEDDDKPDAYWATEVTCRMAEAATLVLRASMEASQFAEQETKP